MAASTVFCAAAGAVMLTLIARRRDGSLGLGGERSRILRIAASAVLMSAVVYLLKVLIGTSMNRYLSLALMIAAGGAVYAASAFAFGLKFSRGAAR